MLIGRTAAGSLSVSNTFFTCRTAVLGSSHWVSGLTGQALEGHGTATISGSGTQWNFIDGVLVIGGAGDGVVSVLGGASLAPRFNDVGLSIVLGSEQDYVWIQSVGGGVSEIPKVSEGTLYLDQASVRASEITVGQDGFGSIVANSSTISTRYLHMATGSGSSAGVVAGEPYSREWVSTGEIMLQDSSLQLEGDPDVDGPWMPSETSGVAKITVAGSSQIAGVSMMPSNGLELQVDGGSFGAICLNPDLDWQITGTGGATGVSIVGNAQWSSQLPVDGRVLDAIALFSGVVDAVGGCVDTELHIADGALVLDQDDRLYIGSHRGHPSSVSLTLSGLAPVHRVGRLYVGANASHDGPPTTAELTLQSGAQLEVQDSLFVGRGSDAGILSVGRDSKLMLTSQFGSAIGSIGQGDALLTVQDGGVVEVLSSRLIVGSTGGSGSVAITGTDSMLLASVVELGTFSGNGSLSLSDGAVLDAGVLAVGCFGVGEDTPSTGSFQIDGAESSAVVSLLTVGEGGNGFVRVGSGGQLTANSISLGIERDGRVGHGSLVAETGSQIQANSINVGSFAVVANDNPLGKSLFKVDSSAVVDVNRLDVGEYGSGGVLSIATDGRLNSQFIAVSEYAEIVFDIRRTTRGVGNPTVIADSLDLSQMVLPIRLVGEVRDPRRFGTVWNLVDAGHIAAGNWQVGSVVDDWYLFDVSELDLASGYRIEASEFFVSGVVSIVCASDLAPPFGKVDLEDAMQFVDRFGMHGRDADFNGDEIYDIQDIVMFVDSYVKCAPD